MFGWLRRLNDDMDAASVPLLPVTQEQLDRERAAMKPRPRFRVVQGPHDERFWVQERHTGAFGTDLWLSGAGNQHWPTQSLAEAWVERELAGPKVVKEFP